MDRWKSPVMWLTALTVGATTLIATWEDMPEGVAIGLIVFLAMLGTFQTYAKVTRVADPHDNAGTPLVPATPAEVTRIEEGRRASADSRPRAERLGDRPPTSQPTD